MVTIATEVIGQAEDRIQSNTEPSHSYSATNLSTILVKTSKESYMFILL